MVASLNGGTTAVFAITLSVAIATPVVLKWETKDGSGKAGIDYVAANGTVEFLPGETEKQIQVTVFGRELSAGEADRLFYIKLYPPTAAILSNTLVECTIKVTDEEGTPVTELIVSQGKRGLKGDPGLSAYEQAVNMGFTGTLQDWMNEVADASQAADRAQASANRAESAATSASFLGNIFPSPEAGVDPETGVPNNAYFNVRSESDDDYIEEYRNLNGIPTPTGKAYPSSQAVQYELNGTVAPSTSAAWGEVPQIKKLTGDTSIELNAQSKVLLQMLNDVRKNGGVMPFNQTFANAIGGFDIGDRVKLDTGKIVVSTLVNNVGNPNTSLLGWTSEDHGLIKSFISLEEVEQDPYDGQIIFIKTRDNESNSFFAGHFQFVAGSTETVDGGIVFNAVDGRWIRVLKSNVLQAQWFGTPNQVNDQIILNRAIIEADRRLMSLDIRGSVWGINGPVYCIKQMQLLCDWTSYISVNSYGIFPEGWAVMFGDPSLTWEEGRALITIIGKLRVECGTRVNNLNGVIFKGAWHSVESVRAFNFNGTGVRLDSLHDSAFQDISVELCGNGEDYAFVCSSNDDTSNCLSVGRLQVEQSFQRGIYITKTIRSLFENIHSERLYITDKTSKPTTVGRDINHVINVDNTQINQALFQSDSDADFFVRMDGVASNFGAIRVHGNLYSEYGGILTYDSCACDSYTQYTAAGSTVFNSLSCENLKLLRDVTINQADVTNFIYGYQCSNITFNGGSVDNVGGGDSSTLALGAYVFNNIKIVNVYKTGASADLTHTAFNDCSITNFYGDYQNNCKVVGGKIKNCDLNTDMYADFTNTQFENFKGNGGIAYTTRNCIATNTATWSTPTLSMLAGIVTERIGYDAAGKIYQNTANGVNWVKIA